MSSFNFLKDRLPRSVSLRSGVVLDIDTRTCRAVACMERLNDATLKPIEKVTYLLNRLFNIRAEDLSEEDMAEAFQKGIEYLCYGEVTKDRKPYKPDMDYQQDSGLILAGFVQTYHMTVDEVQSLHWWLFHELLMALPDDTVLSRVRQLRTMDIPTKGDAKQIAKLRKAKASVKLKDRRTEEQKRADMQRQIDSLDL